MSVVMAGDGKMDPEHLPTPETSACREVTHGLATVPPMLIIGFVHLLRG
jgi:hypothetical protein